MNIFVLSADPTESAQLMCDQHINKMIVESAQLLCTTVHIKYLQAGASPYTAALYKPSHPHHPCQDWLIESLSNASWLLKHARALEIERQVRFDKWTTHQSLPVAEQACVALMQCPTPTESLRHWSVCERTPPKMAMPWECKHFKAYPSYKWDYNWPEVVKSYQMYYRHKRATWKSAGKDMTWTVRQEPAFMSVGGTST